MTGIIATFTFNPGNLVHREEPFVQVVPRQLKDEVCEYCCQKSVCLTPCKECEAVNYCGAECQKKDLTDHRLVCNRLRNLPQCDNQELIHLIGKVILKLKGKDWKTFKTTVLGREVSFEDLNFRELTENPRMVLRYMELGENLKMFVGVENMPEVDDLINIIGKTLYNMISKDSETKSSVLYLFIGASLIDHECIPNCNIGVFNRNLKFWAIKNIKEKQKISASFRNVYSSDLENVLGNVEVCKCTTCSLPYGESILTRVNNERNSSSVINATERFLFASQYFSDIYTMPDVERRVDELLKIQEFALASTNALRLRLLKIKCFEIGSSPLRRRAYLKELEKSVSAVYGKYYHEMLYIYKALIEDCLKLKLLVEVASYTEKVEEFFKSMDSVMA